MANRRMLSMSSAVIAFALTLAATTSAFAVPIDNGNTTVTKVAFNVVAQQLAVFTSDGKMFVANTGGACAPAIAPNAETVRHWASLAQSALLSGKSVNMHYENCNGYRWMQIVFLLQ